jgi:hypothetical protein
MFRWWLIYVGILSLIVMSLWFGEAGLDASGSPPMLGVDSSHI